MAVANLTLTCVLMFIGPMIFGTMPLAFPLGNDWMKWVRSCLPKEKKRSRLLIAPLQRLTISYYLRSVVHPHHL
jgi:hypothetical protein